MRISDWSSDVCSSDLNKKQPRAYVLGPGAAPCASYRQRRQHARRRPHRNRHDIGPRTEQRGLSARTHRSGPAAYRSEEHTSELQSLMRISYAVFCLKKTITQEEINSEDISTSR